MLREFLTDNRDELIERCRVKVATRRAPRATPEELSHGVPMFLAQLTEIFPVSAAEANDSAHESAGRRDIAQAAATHGRELLKHDFTIEQVVHDYGDLCQAITELAVERSAPITVREFGSLNITLDNAIASAVTAFTRQDDAMPAGGYGPAAEERLGALANKMRDLLNTAILATSAMKRGSVGFGGATAAALDRSLIGMRGLIDRTLADVRLDGDSIGTDEMIEIGPFIAAVQLAAGLEAASTGCELTVVVEPEIFVRGDRHTLAAAVANLLHGTVTGATHGGHVFLTARARAGRVIIDVEDDCTCLEPSALDEIVRRFTNRGSASSPLGSTLDAARKAVEANAGTLSARARVIPGKGCLYSIDLAETR